MNNKPIPDLPPESPPEPMNVLMPQLTYEGFLRHAANVVEARENRKAVRAIMEGASAFEEELTELSGKLDGLIAASANPCGGKLARRGMNFREMDETARHFADKEVPKGKVDPIETGLKCAFAALIVLLTFGAFAGIDLDRFPTSSSLTIAVAFLVPYLYFRHQCSRHHSVYLRHMEMLRQTKNNE